MKSNLDEMIISQRKENLVADIRKAGNVSSMSWLVGQVRGI